VSTQRKAPAARADAAKAFDWRLLVRLWAFVRSHWVLLGLALVMIGLAAAFEVVLPYLLKIAIDSHIAIGEIDGLFLIAVLVAAAALGRGIVAMALGYSLALLGQRSMHDLRTALHNHVLTRNAGFFDRTPVGRLLTNITTDVESLYQLFVGGVVTIVSDVVVLLAIIGMMLYLSVELTLVTLVVAPLLIPLFAWTRKVMRTSFRALRTVVGEMSTYAVERIAGVATVQIFCREPQAAQEYAQFSATHRRLAHVGFASAAVSLPITETIASISGALVLWYAAGALEAKALTAGLVVAFIQYGDRLFSPIYVLSQKYTVMQAAMSAAERVFALLDTKDADAQVRAQPAEGVAAAEPALPTRLIPPELGGEGDAIAATAPSMPAVEFRDVKFSYRPGDPVLRDVSLIVPRGTTLAVVGATGSGKSTLMRLLARYYEPQSGEIRVDGLDVRDWPVHELRRHLTVVAQDVFLFAGTVAENVRMGRPDAHDYEVIDALDRVGATSLLARKGGIQNEIAERGANLSTGERQLVSFARALLRDPRVLILDEATAHVDPETEETIERALIQLFAGRTSLIIAHRLSTIRRANQIIVMDKGCVVEQGTRAELLAAGGYYAKLEAGGALANSAAAASTVAP
jgi:ATP-binding cassette, subfamily B, multidrug efflux pump